MSFHRSSLRNTLESLLIQALKTSPDVLSLACAEHDVSRFGLQDNAFQDEKI